MEILFLIFFEVLGPLVLRGFAELGVRATLHATGLRKPTNPIFAALGYVMLASMGAGISLLIFPDHFMKNYESKLLNLILTPILIGAVMSLRGRHLRRKGKTLIRLDSFAYGYLFAVTFAWIRFHFGR